MRPGLTIVEHRRFDAYQHRLGIVTGFGAIWTHDSGVAEDRENDSKGSVMTYKALELPVSADEPFKHDKLGRQPAVEFVAQLLARTGGPFVMALDAPWGSGKTTFVRMLEAELKRSGFACVNFNAWQVDYVTDPLVALVSAVEQIELGPGKGDGVREGLKNVRKVTGLVAKRGAVAAVKAISFGALELDTELEKLAADLAGGLTSDVIAAFQKERELLERFRCELESAIKQLPEAEKKSTLIFIIDELDRCRPTFAIELLERIKHLFDVANIAFVLALDIRQLEASTARVYGERIDAREYLRRFIDLEYTLPAPELQPFTESLLERFGLDTWFAERKHPDVRYDRDTFVKSFTSLADVLALSLRARERCITRLRVVLDQTPANSFLDPVLVALLIVLRSHAPQLFHSLRAGSASPADVIRELGEKPNGRAFLASRTSVMLEAYLMAADPDATRDEQRQGELNRIAAGEESPERARAIDILAIRSRVPGFLRDRIALEAIAAKVDLAAALRR